ncbi:hypothetical protein LIER_34221 [Lithospermum erythrorhizon]|uniref:Uncharacterized protein n=1 Tax=Lithospermum erythrorhizon TaxID=34254 RepID=A0AAV3RZ21_LITER
MAKELEFPTSEETLSFIRDVRVKLLADEERFQQFKQIMTNFKEGSIPAQQVESYVKILLSDQHELVQQFQKFLPVHMKQNHVEKNQENGLQESVVVNKTNSREDTIQEIEKESQQIVFEESEVVGKKNSRKDDIQASLVYIKSVLKGLEDQPDSISKFFDLMEEYKSDLDQEKLKHGLFALFKSCPEFEIEFMQFTIEEPSPIREKAEVFVSKKDVSRNPWEDIKNRYEDEMFYNDMCISRINLAIENTLKFLMECRKGRRTMKVTKYLTSENLKVIVKYCNVKLKDCRHVQESAYSVVGKLKVQLEVEKDNRVNIRRKMVSEIQKLQNKKMRMMLD